MWIDAEPGESLMLRIFLCFEPGNPNPEDRRVRAYLREHGLWPRREFRDQRQGVTCDVLQFGQCYLGGHIHVINGLRRQGVAAEVIAGSLRDDPEAAALVVGLTAEEREDLAWRLAMPMLQRGAVGTDPDDPTLVLVDAQALCEEIRQALAV
jgi:hypothetical protein